MEQKKIDRINELARLAKERTLTAEEESERAALRREYIDAMKFSLKSQLDTMVIVDEKGNRRKVAPKKH